MRVRAGALGVLVFFVVVVHLGTLHLSHRVCEGERSGSCLLCFAGERPEIE